MVRKSLFIVLSAVVVLSVSVVGWAQDVWKWNEFNADYERFYYESVTYTSSWDWELGEEVEIEVKTGQLLELRKVDDEYTEVTQGHTVLTPTAELKDQLSFLGGFFSLSSAFSSSMWISESMMLGMFAQDLELEVGNTMQLFDGSRIRVLDEVTVAGIKGYLVRRFRRETDEEGNRVDILTSEWVIAPNVGWPLDVKIYQEDKLVYQMTLKEYERR
ncbi:MAG: hypothetical protein ACOYEU_09605 [Limnochordia bacterium]|jgi:hypothetical protein